MVVLNSQYDDGEYFAEVDPSIRLPGDWVMVNREHEPLVPRNIHREQLIQVFAKLVTARRGQAIDISQRASGGEFQEPLSNLGSAFRSPLAVR
jgi:hypothetical protein